MAVKDIMSIAIETIPNDTSILDAAKTMKQLGCGFLPVSDSNMNKLCGVVTDRDIVLRAVARDMNPADTTVNSILSEKVLYCYEQDNIETAANSMRDQGVYRLLVLDNDEEKNLVGIVSLGDLVRSGQTAVASEASEGILAGQIS